MWNLYENDKKLEPLVFSNKKTQEDIVNEILDAIKKGHKIIFIRGMCGTGKSGIALNIAKHFNKTSIVVPVKSLQEQYTNDYTINKYVLKNGKKLKISSIFGRKNFKCKYLESDNVNHKFQKTYKEINAKLSDIFYNASSKIKNDSDDESCDNFYIPCKIELKEKNLPKLKHYIQKNPDIKFSDFESIKDIRRMSIAPVCPYWSPILPDDIELKKFSECNKVHYKGLNGRNFTMYQRRPGCKYYEQYVSYRDSDVIIFNANKYLIENVLDRKPETQIDIIDECDDFLDSFSNLERINLNRLIITLSNLYTKDSELRKEIDNLIGIANLIKGNKKYQTNSNDIFYLPDSDVMNLIKEFLDNPKVLDLVETEETNYLSRIDEIAQIFRNFLTETYYSVENSDNEFIISLVTTNLEKRFEELIEKNNVLILMSGTIHSDSVLKNIFGLQDYIIIDAETAHYGELIKCKHGFEMDCKYSNFKNNVITREKYLKALSKAVECSIKPTVVHITSFSDLPNKSEVERFNLHNLPNIDDFILKQRNDPLGKRVTEFKKGKFKVLFTTKCTRGIDFPGKICNSMVITRYPYPNISSLFWRILKKTKPAYFMGFYMDKAKRELLQRIYRGLRSKHDKMYLLSPDLRVLEYDFG